MNRGFGDKHRSPDRPGRTGPRRQRGGNVGWHSIRDSVNHLTLLFEGGAEMWIDDIRIQGINRTDVE